MSAFLPARQLWGWSGKGYKRSRAKGRSRKQFFKAIQRGKESITVCVFCTYVLSLFYARTAIPNWSVDKCVTDCTV